MRRFALVAILLTVLITVSAVGVLGSTVATSCVWDRETGALVYAKTS